MTLSVLCDNGQTYPYFITVKATQTLPKLTVKQTEKFNLFYRNSEAPLATTGGEVESAELIGTDDFVLENNDGTYVIRYADPENVPEKPDTKAQPQRALRWLQRPRDQGSDHRHVEHCPETDPESRRQHPEFQRYRAI